MQPEEVSEIMHTLNERAATKIGWLAITRKNYMGRHDQQTHTTLFNLANPSQGRNSKISDEYMRLAQDPEKNRVRLMQLVDAAAKAVGGEVYYRGGELFSQADMKKPYIWLAEDEEYANRYTRRIMPAFGPGLPEYDPDADKDTRAEVQDTKRFYVIAKKPLDLTPYGEDMTLSMSRDQIGKLLRSKGVKVSNEDLYSEGRRQMKDRAALWFTFTTDSAGLVKRKIEEAGYDSVKFFESHALNDPNSPAQRVIALFSPTQIKSADPVTYDTTGKIIPLSRRFNISSPLVAEKRSDVNTTERASDTVAKTTSARDNFGVKEVPISPNVFVSTLTRQSFVSSSNGETGGFRRLTGVKEKIVQEINDWTSTATTPVGRLASAKSMAKNSILRLQDPDSVVQIVRDKNNQLSGVLTFSKTQTIKKGYIEVEFVGTNPSAGNRAGTNLIFAVARIAAKQGKGLALESLIDSVPFYKKIGFIQTGGTMYLSKEATQAFVSGMNIKNNELNNMSPEESTKEIRGNRMTEALAKYFDELDAIYDKCGAEVTSSRTTTKNYMGRHDQQTHTTLFNLANPSQGRRDVARGGEVRELTGSTAPPATTTPTTMSASELARYNLSFILGTAEKVEEGINLNQLAVGFERRISGELDSSKKDIVKYVQDVLARAKVEVNSEFGMPTLLEVWSQRTKDSADRAAKAAQRAKDLPNNEGLQRLSQSYNRLHAYHLAVTTLLYRDNNIGLQDRQQIVRGEWKGDSRSPNPLKQLTWDGNTTSYEIPQYGKSGGLADKSVLGGAKTKEFIQKVVKELGLPEAFLRFAVDQPFGRPRALADYSPNTSITTPIANTVTVYPKLVGTNAKTNSTQTIRGVLGHETAHMRYETVSLAVRTATTPASSRDLAGQIWFAESVFGVRTAGSLRQAGFLGSKYEEKMLKAITDPTSVFRVGKDGLPKAKRGYEEYLSLFKTDGLTDYSASYWKDFSVFPSAKTLKLAINETLAEVTRLTELGHGGKISRLWRDASELLNSTYGKLGSPWNDIELDSDTTVKASHTKIKEKSEYVNVKFPKQSIIDALRGLVDKYQADKSAKIAAANPLPEKYTSKSLKNLTKQHGLLSTKLLRVALKNTEGKKMKMIILGQTGESILVVDSGQNLDSALAKGFILDLDEQKATSVGVAQSYKYVPWVEPDANLKIPKWFTGKSTPPITLSRDELDHIRVYLEGDHIDLNELLRNNSKPSQKQNKVMDALDKAIIVYGTTDYEELYGAIPDLSAANLGLIEGLKFKDYGMQSAYDNMESARDLLEANITTNNGTLIKYTTREQKRRKLIDMKFMGEANEFLFPRNTIFTVVELQRSQDDRYDIVTMDAAY